MTITVTFDKSVSDEAQTFITKEIAKINSNTSDVRDVSLRVTSDINQVSSGNQMFARASANYTFSSNKSAIATTNNRLYVNPNADYSPSGLATTQSPFENGVAVVLAA